MNKIKKNIVIFLSVFITLIICIYFSYSYITVLKLLYKESFVLFVEAIEREQQKRIIDNEFIYSIKFNENQYNDFSIVELATDFSKIKKSEGEIIEPHTNKVYKGLETALYLDSLLPDVYALDSIFQSLLITQKLPYKIAVKYIDNLKNIEFSSSSDSAFYLKTDTLSSFTTGVRQELTFKGYVAIPSAYVFRQMKVSLTIIGMIWLICMGIIAFILFRKDPAKEEKTDRD